MTMQECYEAIGGNYEAVLGRRCYKNVRGQLLQTVTAP